MARCASSAGLLLLVICVAALAVAHADWDADETNDVQTAGKRGGELLGVTCTLSAAPLVSALLVHMQARSRSVHAPTTT
jgi:hypothetical protein